MTTITERELQILDEAIPAIRKDGFYMTKEMADYAVENPEAFKALVLNLAEETLSAQKGDTNRMDVNIFEAVEAIDNSSVALDTALQILYVLQELHMYNPKRPTDPPQEDAHDLYRAYRMSQTLVHNIVEEVEQTIATLESAAERLRRTTVQADTAN